MSGFPKIKFKKFGVLAEPYAAMTESAALELTLKSGMVSFERIAVGARNKSSLPDEAWEPVERILKRKSRRMTLSRPVGVWAVALSAVITAALLIGFTPPGRALAGEAMKQIEKIYKYIVPPTEAPRATADIIKPTETPTVTEPLVVPSLSDEPSPVPSAEQVTHRPTEEPTPEPTAEPTPEPTPVPTVPPVTGHVCGEEGCVEGIVNGAVACIKNGTLHICRANFPDPRFREYIRRNFDNGSGGLSVSELREIEYIWCENAGIGSLGGVEFFAALRSLQCPGNGLEKVDLSHNGELQYLVLGSNRLTEIDFSSCRKLHHVDVSGNALTSVRFTGLSELTSVNVSSNPLTSLSLAYTGHVEELICSDCRIMDLDLGSNHMLNRIMAGGNRITRITGLILSHYQIFDVSGNRLLWLDLGPTTYSGEYILSPQTAQAFTGYFNESFFEIDLSPRLDGRHESIVRVFGLDGSGSWIEGNYHRRKGIARFSFIPVMFKYCYDTGRGLMEVTAEVTPPVEQ